MQTQRWKQLSALFEAALDLPGAQRETYIVENCANDLELMTELRRMLAADAQAESDEFLERPLATPATQQWRDDPMHPGGEYAPGSRQFGPYRLLRPIGQGGMGEVHLAERSDGAFEQRVALKLLPHPTPGLIQRFRQERQILAHLEHPNIARLLDGGVGEESVPYFAMEYVDGEPITTYVAAQKSSITPILQLFLRVCDAVQYAHRNLVVHRDIKPSNVLVTADGTPKLLDFGIAKILEATDTDDNTRTATRMFTPDYAAPEQIRGEPITTATDVYALGVVLYELLTGARPYKLARGKSLEQSILNTQPVAPSLAVQNTTGNTTQRSRTLRGDLDRIVLTALAKEPERRYSSAETFAADIRNYLDGRPIAARGDSPLYRLRKFIRRNRIVVVAALIVALTMGGAAIFGLRQARIATAQATRAETVKRFVLSIFESNNPDENHGEKLTALQLLNRGADRAEKELADQPVLQGEIYATIGGLFTSVGMYDRAQETLKKAIAVNDAYPATPGEQRIAALRGLAESYAFKGDTAASIANLRKAAEVAESMGDSGLEQSLDLRRDIVTELIRIASYADAEKLQRDVLALDRKRYGESDLRVGTDWQNLGILLWSTARYPEAETAERNSLTILRAIHDDENRAIARSLQYLSVILRDKHDLKNAEQVQRESIAMSIKLEGPDSINTQAAQVGLGGILLQSGKFEDSATIVRDVIAAKKTARADNDGQAANAYNSLSQSERLLGLYADAESDQRRAIAIWETTVGAKHPNTANSRRNLALVLAERGAYPEAEHEARSALATMLENFPEESVEVGRSHAVLASMLRLQHRYSDAVAEATLAVAALQAKLANTHAFVIGAMTELGNAQLRAGQSTLAHATLEQALADARKAYAADDFAIAGTLLAAAMSDNERNDYAAAQPLLVQASAICTNVYKANHPLTVQIQLALAETLAGLNRGIEAKRVLDGVRAAFDSMPAPAVADLRAQELALRSRLETRATK